MTFWQNNKADMYIQLYDEIAANLKTDAEIKFIKQYFKKTDSIIELGCGTGRTLIPLFELEYNISGLDFSKNMLDILRQKIKTKKIASPHLLQKDLTKFSLNKKYDGAILSQRTLNFIIKPENQRKAIINIAKILKKDATLIINLMPGRPDDFSKSQVKIKKTETVINSKTGKKVHLYENWIPDPMKQTWSFINQFKEGKNKTETKMVMRVIFEQEMKYLLEACGFTTKAVYGDWNKNPYTAESRHLIFVAKKA